MEHSKITFSLQKFVKSIYLLAFLFTQAQT